MIYKPNLQERGQRWEAGQKKRENYYVKKLPISIQKKTDRIQLCAKGIIPEEFHHFFKTLPVDKQVNDKNLDEDSADTDTE